MGEFFVVVVVVWRSLSQGQFSGGGWRISKGTIFLAGTFSGGSFTESSFLGGIFLAEIFIGAVFQWTIFLKLSRMDHHQITFKLHKKLSFPLRLSSVNVTKSAQNQIYILDCLLFAIFSENLVFVLFNMGDANYKDYNIGISCFSCVWRRA